MSAPAEHVLTQDVYLNHFSPAEAHEEEIRRDVTMVLFGIALWDVLVYIPSDFKIIKETGFNFVNFSFIVSRIMVLVYVTSVMIARTISIDDYNLTSVWRATIGSFVAIIISSSYLFLRRVLAIYNSEKLVRWCFIAFWAVLAICSCIVTPLGTTPTLFPHTSFYQSGDLKPWAAFADWGLLLFDTAVVVAISIKLGTSFHHSSTEYNNRDNMVSWYGILTGNHLPRFARAILRGGQLYYSVTVGMMILVGAIVSLPMFSPIYKDLIAGFFVFFSASMACRAFRNLRLFDSDVEFIWDSGH